MFGIAGWGTCALTVFFAVAVFALTVWVGPKLRGQTRRGKVAAFFLNFTLVVFSGLTTIIMLIIIVNAFQGFFSSFSDMFTQIF